MRFLKLFGLTMLVAMLFSCSPQKRYQRLIKKHPELIERDTTWWHDTFYFEKKVYVPEYRDSFIITKDTVIETKRFIVTKYKDIFKIVCKADTLTYTDTVTVSKAVPGKVIYVSKTNWNYIWIILVVGLIAGVLLSRKK
jgi:ElaB/YqjD/DUF883 family membrane-anchored ribosome-binding protein